MWFRQEASYISSETKGQRAVALSGGQDCTAEAGVTFLVPSGVAGWRWWLICVSQAYFPCLLQVFKLGPGKRCISLLTWGAFLKLSTTGFSPSCVVIKKFLKQDNKMTFHYQVSLNSGGQGRKLLMIQSELSRTN